MQKRELVKKVAEKSDMKIVEVESMFEAFIEVIKEAFNSGERVEFHGFGNFVKKTRKARRGYSFSDGKSIDIPAKDVLIFKMSPSFNKDKK